MGMGFFTGFGRWRRADQKARILARIELADRRRVAGDAILRIDADAADIGPEILKGRGGYQRHLGARLRMSIQQADLPRRACAVQFSDSRHNNRTTIRHVDEGGRAEPFLHQQAQRAGSRVVWAPNGVQGLFVQCVERHVQAIEFRQDEPGTVPREPGVGLLIGLVEAR